MKTIAIVALLAATQAVQITSLKEKDESPADCPCKNESCMLKTEDDANIKAAKEIISLGKSQLHAAQVSANKDGKSCTKSSTDVVKKVEKKEKAKVEKIQKEVKVAKKEEEKGKDKVVKKQAAVQKAKEEVENADTP